MPARRVEVQAQPPGGGEDVAGERPAQRRRIGSLSSADSGAASSDTATGVQDLEKDYEADEFVFYALLSSRGEEEEVPKVTIV